MPTVQYFRAPNPIWFFHDLTGNPLDDTYYAHFLTNTLPYIPQPPYDSPFSTANVWTGGVVQFQNNGGLPDNLYFDPDAVYRIEIRQGSTQSDPLIYEINNFQSGGDGGGDIVDDVGFTAGNLITNPQFDIVEFNPTSESDLTEITIAGSTTLEIIIGPKWILEVTNNALTSRTIELGRIYTTGQDNIPGQAPNFLRVDVSSLANSDEIYLRQRFEGNNSLFYSTDDQTRYVSTYLTAKSSNASAIEVDLINDGGADSNTISLISDSLSADFREYFSVEELPLSNISDSNPDGYSEYRITIQGGQIFDVTSVQIVSQTISGTPRFAQQSNERKKDHMFNYYSDSILIMPKTDILAGWNFSHNPWQFRTTASSNLANQTMYAADGSIVYQRGGANTLASSQGSLADNLPLQLTAVTNDNKFVLFQYIDSETARSYWQTQLSALVKAKITTMHSTQLKFKMRLMYRASEAPTLSATEPFASWANTDNELPVLAAGWSYVVPKNDPIYTFDTAYSNFVFEGMELPVSTNAVMTFGIAIIMLNNMDETATADSVEFERVTLVPNQFAIDAYARTFGEDLKRCQRYYAKSFEVGTVPATAAGNAGVMYYTQTVSPPVLGASPSYDFPCTMYKSPDLTLYNPVNANNLIHNTATVTDCPTSNITNFGKQRFIVEMIPPGGSAIGNGLEFHYAANALLGN